MEPTTPILTIAGVGHLHPVRHRASAAGRLRLSPRRALVLANRNPVEAFEVVDVARHDRLLARKRRRGRVGPPVDQKCHSRITLQALRIELGKSYHQTIELLSEMPDILDEIGLTRLPHFTVLRAWFEEIPMETYHAFLGESAEKRTGHAAIDSTGFDRDQPTHGTTPSESTAFDRSKSPLSGT